MRYGINGKEARRVVPMWETTNALYHHGEKERAKHLEGEEPQFVYVGVPKNFFISTWQYKDAFKGFIFDTEDEAEEFINKHNNLLTVD